MTTMLHKLHATTGSQTLLGTDCQPDVASFCPYSVPGRLAN
jgi:hypothetical protein